MAIRRSKFVGYFVCKLADRLVAARDLNDQALAAAAQAAKTGQTVTIDWKGWAP